MLCQTRWLYYLVDKLRAYLIRCKETKNKMTRGFKTFKQYATTHGVFSGPTKPDKNILSEWIEYKFEGGQLSYRAYLNRINEMKREKEQL